MHPLQVFCIASLNDKFGNYMAKAEVEMEHNHGWQEIHLSNQKYVLYAKCTLDFDKNELQMPLMVN